MIKLYYSSESRIGKQAVGYVNASYKDVLAVDIMKSNVTGTQWKDMAEHLNLTIGELIDKEHPKFQENYDHDANLSEDGWIKILDEKPEVFTNAIAIIGNDYILVENPSDIEKYLDPNSKGINERKYIQKDIEGSSDII